MRAKALVPWLAALLALGAAAPAGASFHLMKIREVQPDATGVGGNQTEFTVLQATSPGQNLLTNHRVTFFHADGTESGGCVFPANPAAAATQQTYLIAQPQSAFTLTTDCPYGAGGDPLQATGGAVCWDNTHIDCMAYGAFNNTTAQLPVGTPAPAPPAGMALTRTNSRGCPTALDDADDTNDSAADFSITAATPRNSTSPITETPCISPTNGGANKPNTKIKKRPKDKSDDTSPTFKFKSTEAGSTFKCKLDAKKFKKCKSPKTFHGLDPGKHKFKVEAIDSDGNVDSTPAKDKFKVLP